jgi:hypothetical protein
MSDQRKERDEQRKIVKSTRNSFEDAFGAVDRGFGAKADFARMYHTCRLAFQHRVTPAAVGADKATLASTRIRLVDSREISEAGSIYSARIKATSHCSKIMNKEYRNDDNTVTQLVTSPAPIVSDHQKRSISFSKRAASTKFAEEAKLV